MNAKLIAVDFDLLDYHRRRLSVIAEDIGRARQAASSINLTGGAFGLLCTPLLVPGVSVVEVAARNAIGDAANLVEETAVATGLLASDYRETEYAAVDLIRKLGTELGIDTTTTYGLRGAYNGSSGGSGGGGSGGARAGSNPLISGPIDRTTALSGTFLLEDGQALADSINNQDWLSCGMAAFSTAVDTAAMISDPIGQLFAMGFGWLLDHVEPLKGWLDDLTGDAGEVAGFAHTWRNIETQLTESGSELERVTANTFTDMHGAGMDAAIAFHRDLATHLGAAGRWAGAMGTGLEISSTIVQIVHDITRDAIAEVAGAICSYVLEAVFTLGAATPLIIEQASTKAFAIAARIGRHIDNLKTALKNLRQLLDKLGTMFDQLGITFRSALKGGSDAGSVRVDAIVPGASRIEPTPRPGETLSPARTNIDGGDGIVTFKARQDWDADQLADARAYVDGANRAADAGDLAASGRVSTAGPLRRQADRAARAERGRAAAAGTPYRGHVGHLPDTTWTGQPVSPQGWLDMHGSVNSSVGRQAQDYPIGFKPSGFELALPDGTHYPPRPPTLEPPKGATR